MCRGYRCTATLPDIRLQVGTIQSGQWPGTVSWDDPASVYWLNFSVESAAVLGAQVEGLYHWDTGNGQPEDLALLCEDGREFLASVAHERESWMWLTDEEHAYLCEQVPQLASLLRTQ